MPDPYQTIASKIAGGQCDICFYRYISHCILIFAMYRVQISATMVRLSRSNPHHLEYFMKTFHRVTLIAGVASAMFLAACSSTPVAPAPVAAAPVAQPAAVAVAPAPAAPKPAEAAPVVKMEVAPYLDPKNALYQQRSVYFDFDKSAIKPEGLSVLELHGKFLADHPSVAVKVEGNADERGGAEYNLALGQKRADAVVKALKTYGVKDAQLEAVSYGKEKPKALGHDEPSYAENRRADLAYPSK